MQREKMPDPIDVGSHLAELERESLLAVQRRKAAPHQVKTPLLDANKEPVLDVNGDYIMVWPTEVCVECGEPIGPGRLANGYHTCISCARASEVRSKQYAN